MDQETQMRAEKRAKELHQSGMGWRRVSKQLDAEGLHLSNRKLRAVLGIKNNEPGRGKAPGSLLAVVTDEPTKDPVDVVLDLLIKRKDHGLSQKEVAEYPEGVLATLEQRGYTLTVKTGRIVLERDPQTQVKDKALEGIFDPRRKVYRIAIISDSHLGGFQAQPGFIRAIFQEAERRGCSAVLHCGDHVDGSPRMHAGFVHELGLHSVDEQVDYTAELYSELQMPLLALGGNHDGSWFKDCGIDVVRLIAARTDNVINLGPIQAWLAGPDGSPDFVRMFHPGNGSSYALSYADQKTAEYLVLENGKVPRGLHLTGHYHKYNAMRGPNGARYLLVPSSCGTTSFMKAKKLINWAGALFIEFTIDREGRLDRCLVEDIVLPPDQWSKCFYDKKPKVTKTILGAQQVWGA